jgi:hypothetical protein
MVPSAKLTAGPAIAIQNSIAALVGSVAICETPPKMNKVIRGTAIP